MTEISYTLMSEGTSDQALIPILNWLLREHLSECAIQAEWADLGRLPNPPKSMAQRMKASLQLYPCDILFVHRDGDGQGRASRIREIQSAQQQLDCPASSMPLICIVPIRMTEAWLVFDETAIRHAADNPRGMTPLALPQVKTIENLPNPKAILQDLLEEASGASGRRLKKFKARIGAKVQRLPEIVEDFSPLRQLSAFQALETDVQKLLNEHF